MAQYHIYVFNFKYKIKLWYKKLVDKESNLVLSRDSQSAFLRDIKDYQFWWFNQMVSLQWQAQVKTINKWWIK